MKLTLRPPAPLGELRSGRREYPSGCPITSHNGHCVTIEPRRRCNMSHGYGSRTCWHARCLYHTMRADRRSGRKQASEFEESTGGISAGWRPPVPCPLIRRTTLLHTSKRPIDQPRESGVFSFHPLLAQSRLRRFGQPAVSPLLIPRARERPWPAQSFAFGRGRGSGGVVGCREPNGSSAITPPGVRSRRRPSRGSLLCSPRPWRALRRR